ncbi:unnamed protein product [Brachionus calyciflorus]|uniref:G-protein coupled receptors family 1 profile domain-containing protein n=1 Tax=Brachionus calyciflorus TaxID=104777 RepID=A0A814RL66_9BILA|nr:unnamed protein product [Brachionus calyciflorus]
MNFLIGLNSLFNVLFILIYLCHLINECVSRNGLFCSSINREISSQYFDIYLVNLVGNYLKILSSISSVGISLIRYLLLSEGYNSILANLFKKIQKFKSFFYILLIGYLISYGIQVLISLNLNENSLILDEMDEYREFPKKNAFVVFYSSGRLIIDIKEKFSNIIFGILVFNYVINDLIFFVILCSIEIIILIKARNSLKSKLIMSTMSISRKKIEKSSAKITRVICINLSVSILFRFIDFSISSYLVDKRRVNHYINFNICYAHDKICSTLKELSDVSFLASISYTSVIYFKLNKQFRDIIKYYFFKSSLNDLGAWFRNEIP